MRVKVGNCGWNYLNPREFYEVPPKGTRLQVYSKLYNLVEINSTFYRLPRKETPSKWRTQANKINPEFEFTLKVSRVITHTHRFLPECDWAFDRMKEIGKALNATVLLFQTPASFKPTPENIDRLRAFFTRIDRENFKLVLETRWQDVWTEEIVFPLFEELDLTQCIDPLRQDWFYGKRFAYFRLHGFGQPMYNYTFSDKELNKILTYIKFLDVEEVYVLFNNATCYKDAMRFKKMLKEV